MFRSSGVLMPMSSLPSPHGIGGMGQSAYDFVDFLKAAGQSWWQLLPLVPTGAGDSPYSSFSTFAGNPFYIDLDMLVRDKLLTEEEIRAVDWGGDPARVDYEQLRRFRPQLLRLAFAAGLCTRSEKARRGHGRLPRGKPLGGKLRPLYGPEGAF